MLTIKQLRRAADMTQQELASRLGVLQKQVSRWERGETAPSVEQLRAIAALFGVSMDDIQTPRIRSAKDVLTKEGYAALTPAERRQAVKLRQIKDLSKWGAYGETFARLSARIPGEWYSMFSAEHLAEVIDLLQAAYSDGKHDR